MGRKKEIEHSAVFDKEKEVWVEIMEREADLSFLGKADGLPLDRRQGDRRCRKERFSSLCALSRRTARNCSRICMDLRAVKTRQTVFFFKI